MRMGNWCDGNHPLRVFKQKRSKNEKYKTINRIVNSVMRFMVTLVILVGGVMMMGSMLVLNTAVLILK